MRSFHDQDSDSQAGSPFSGAGSPAGPVRRTGINDPAPDDATYFGMANSHHNQHHHHHHHHAPVVAAAGARGVQDIRRHDSLRNGTQLSPSSTAPSSNPSVVLQRGASSMDNLAAGDDTPVDDDRHSVGGGTASTGDSGEGDEDDELMETVMDVVRQVYNVQKLASIQPGRSPGHEEALLEESASSPLSMHGSSHNAVTGGAPNVGKALRLKGKEAVSDIFMALNTQSARALLIADPVNDKIVWVNEAAQRLFGRLDLVGSPLEILMPGNIAEKHVGFVDSYVARYKASFRKTGESCDSRLLDLIDTRHLKVMRMQNGREHPFFINGWVRTLRVPGEDRSEPSRLMALEAFDAQKYHDDAQSARIFRAALEHVSDAVVICDFDGRIEWANKALEQLAGFPLSMLLAQRASLNVFLSPDFVERHEGYLAHFRQTRRNMAADMEAAANETVVRRRTEMRTSYGTESIELRVDVAYNRLVGYMKSTKEFIPRDEFENERLRLLLPAAVVKMIRGQGSAEITSQFWDFENASVMFTDLAGFSTWSKNRSAKNVHDRMQPMFSELEDIIAAFGGELIHRIGDAILAVFGFNGEERYHARYAVACAVEMQQWAHENQFHIRLGIHSGPIGAGIYGSSKGRPAFDIWGPVVNTAKRLEEKGVPGAIQMSSKTLDKLGTRFSGELHSVLEKNQLSGVKGLDHEMETYLLRVSGSAPVSSPADRSSVGTTAGLSPTMMPQSSSSIVLPDRFLQQVGAVRAKYARWKIQSEETERRLAELQKASRA